MFYHTLTFGSLLVDLNSELHHALIEKPQQLRSQRLTLGALFPTPRSGEDAWNILYSYLGDLEAELAAILSRRPVQHWIHIYRRLGVELSPDHDRQTDPATVGLVRDIVELATLKYGRYEPGYKLMMSTDVGPAKILGGLFTKYAKRHLTAKERTIFFGALRSRPQWVLTDFNEQDFVDIHYVEGLAYQYWRATAALRMVGKGVTVVFNQGNWDYSRNLALEYLIDHYDKRALNTPFDSVLHGSWFSKNMGARSAKTSILSLGYNVDRQSSREILSPFDETNSINEYTPNFYMAFIDVYALEKSTEFLAEEFKSIRGYSIASLIMVLRAIHVLSLFPPKWDETDLESERFKSVILEHIVNLLQRGYSIKPFSTETILDVAMRIGEQISVTCDPDDIGRAIRALTLNPPHQARVGLWSRGPRFPIVEHADGFLFNLEGVDELLNRLFVRVRDRLEAKGSSFEQHFRTALTEAGYNLEAVGEIVNEVGNIREIDASVRVGNTLILFECRSMERPLDYELSKISTMQTREADLSKKVEQVLTLKKFVEEFPQGRNYDFSWAQKVEAFVVSPFIEYIWTLNERLWEGKTPRVLSASEALDHVRTIN